MPRRGRATTAVDGVEVGGARQSPAARSGTRHDLGREVLAAALAPALEDGAARARAHALAEAVLLCALALVGLIGALHVGSSSRRDGRRGSVAAARPQGRVHRRMWTTGARRRPRRAESGSRGGVARPARTFTACGRALWKSQECPLRAGFRCSHESLGRRCEPLASAPLAPSARRRSIPACAVDVRCHASRSLHPDLLWTAVADRIRDDLSPMVFGAWFSTTRALALDGDVLEVGVPNEFTRSWIEGHFAELVRKAATAADPGVSVRFLVADGEPSRARRARARARARPGRRRPSARGAPRGRRVAALEVHVRLVRDRQLEPLRARRGAGRRRGAGPGLQPARHLRRDGPRQDPSPAGDRRTTCSCTRPACAPAT